MKTSRCKTNVKCAGCVARIAEKLDRIVPRPEWNIDLSSPDKILTVTTDEPDSALIAAVTEAGYKAEKL